MIAEANGQWPSFARAKIGGSGGFSVDFQAAVYRGAEISDYTVRFSRFIDCDFRDVKGAKVVLSGCDIAGSDFRGAVGFTLKNERNRKAAKL